MNINKNGLDDNEQLVMNKLMDCYENFIYLERQHPDELREFGLAVHIIQGILTTRIARRCFPDGWPTYNDNIYKTKNNMDETGGYDVDLNLYSSGLPKIENANSSGSKINKTINRPPFCSCNYSTGICPKHGR